MKAFKTLVVFALLCAACLAPTAYAQVSATASSNTYSTSRKLQTIVQDAAQVTFKEFANQNLKPDELAITLIDLRDAKQPARASFRGDAPVYPASVVKLFYLVAAHQEMEAGKLPDTKELRRALRDMIVDSSNDATSYVLDAITDTSSGVELPLAEMTRWAERRNLVNRYFAGLGYTGININQKTWCEAPYGRERVFLGEKYVNRNKLTTDATARLLAEIATGRAVNPERSRQMMELLARTPSAQSDDPDNQASGFTGIALRDVAGARLWSKAGWTSTTRHDAAYVELPSGARFVLVVFTSNHSRDRDIIPTVARHVVEHFSQKEQAGD